jgi:hypothetical protein
MQAVNVSTRLFQPSPGKQLYRWQNPRPSEIGANAYEFLQRLPGPTHIELSGKTRSRARIVVTLMHGNEPSGLHAVYAALRDQIKPVVDTHIFIPSVDAAKQAPGFIYRALPHHRDLNRCFSRPGDSEQHQLAQEILTAIQALPVEAVIDIHNTSGSGPSFAVATHRDDRLNCLASLFTHRMIISDIRLGSLMENSTARLPIVTIECGGAMDLESNALAAEGLRCYLQTSDLFSPVHPVVSLEFFHHPVRLELTEGSEIVFGDHQLLNKGLTLLPDLEQHNFGFVDRDTLLGFVAGDMQQLLQAQNAEGTNVLGDNFRCEGGKLYPARQLKLFMITTNPEIARKDCLFYFTASSPET